MSNAFYFLGGPKDGMKEWSNHSTVDPVRVPYLPSQSSEPTSWCERPRTALYDPHTAIKLEGNWAYICVYVGDEK